MIWNLLDDTAATNNQYMIYIVLAVVVVLFIVYLLFSGRKSKQRQKEYTEQLEAIGPNNKVKTIGGICGIVVEVCDDNTVIIRTGSEQSGYSYMKMDKECIAQTDAKGPTQIARERAEAQKASEKQAKKGSPVTKTTDVQSEEKKDESEAPETDKETK